jgi:hypothetical protein
LATTAGGIANATRLRLDGWGIGTTVIGGILGAFTAGLVMATAVALVVRWKH